ncbi:MAG TPA: phenylalanine--tRNA ligase subunit beta [Candidatus Babeliales bacterium]|nr:phenylalanine--tRNA ligase subunit beta [Candidatus Babeliales bacterium]
MKLSVAWIFEHIKAVDWSKLDLTELVTKFNQITAEIESCASLELSPEHFTLVEVLADQKIFSPELNLNLELPARANLKIGELYLACKNINNHKYKWASLADLGSTKDGLLTAVSCPENLRTGGWKSKVVWQDAILEIDNKSITHRPDLWCHRGIAREIAAIYGFELRELSEFVTKIPVVQVSPDNLDSELLVNKQDLELVVGCQKFSSYLINYTENPATDLAQAFMLARLDYKPIRLLVDLTNYVMLDLGQPMHAFDADKLVSDSVQVRYARAGEQLELLDDQKINLENTDLIITSGDQPVSLAAIMGGKNSGISNHTSRVLLEAANFASGVIRRTAVRLKLRTEASARFEKSLDPGQTELAIERYLKLLIDLKINYQAAKFINSSTSANNNVNNTVNTSEYPSSKNYNNREIKVTHAFIEQRLGVTLKPEFVQATLSKLGFGVAQEFISVLESNAKTITNNTKNNPELAVKDSQSALLYTIAVPSYRVTKDISLPEDIVEEVGRFYGYGNIAAQLPTKALIPFNNQRVYNLRKIKQLLATTGQMHEVNNYPFFDEQFLHELQWQPRDHSYVQVDSPVSENWSRLVTALVPHLIKNVYQNLNTGVDYFNFFECNKTWDLKNQQKAQENFSLAGVVATTKINRKNFNNHSFYELKAILTQLFKLLKLEVSWELIPVSALNNLPAWYDPAQTAVLISKTNHSSAVNSNFNNYKLGLVGKLNSKFWANLSDTELDGLIFELDLDYLLNYSAPIEKFVPISKYQISYLDVTVLVAPELTMAQLIQTIQTAHSLIQSVELIDSFTKPEWQGQRALTFRYKFLDPQKTLVKAEIEQIQAQVISALQQLGVEIR